MAWLLIDNSNSRTKFQLADACGLLDWRTIMPTAEIDSETLRQITDGIEFSGVAVASVVPEKEEILRLTFGNEKNYHRLTAESPLGYGFDVEFPEQIGHDRLANVIALNANYAKPGIAIDFGTAVTFSVLSQNGLFAGGVIAPGMQCMTEYLAAKTAQLPKIEPAAISSALGKNTVEALQIGAVLGHRGMVREILHGLLSEIHGSPVIVATGGGADFAARGLKEIQKVDPDLTLEGLRILAKRVF